jgi:hypothetical protein
MKKLPRLLLLIALNAACLGCWSAAAQVVQNEQQLQLVESSPAFGTFWLVQDKAPYPFDPFFGQLPIYDVGGGIYLVDDSQVAYSAMQEGGGAFTSSEPSPPCDPCPSEGGGVTNSYVGGWTTNAGLKFKAVPYITNGTSYVTVLDSALSIKAYQVFQATQVLGSTLITTNLVWSFITNGPVGVSNFTFTLPSTNSTTMAYYIAADAKDSDSDGFSDAYEYLILHSNPNQFNDTNSDGMGENQFVLEWDQRTVDSTAAEGVLFTGNGIHVVGSRAPVASRENDTMKSWEEAFVASNQNDTVVVSLLNQKDRRTALRFLPSLRLVCFGASVFGFNGGSRSSPLSFFIAKSGAIACPLPPLKQTDPAPRIGRAGAARLWPTVGPRRPDAGKRSVARRVGAPSGCLGVPFSPVSLRVKRSCAAVPTLPYRAR